VPISTYLVAGLIAYAAANTALGGLAITLVIRREYGILKRLRSTPLPAPLYLSAVLLSNLLVVVLQSLVVVALGLGLFDAQLPENWLSFVLALGLGAASFAGLGLAIAALVRSGEAIAAVVNVIILPMSFLSGSFGPADALPGALEALRDVLPLRYLIDLVLGAYVDGDALWERPTAIAVLAAWGAAGYVVARRRFGWEPRER
jgi:ABC-2 type transport system permease protein